MATITNSGIYDHSRFELRRRFLRFLMKHLGFRVLAKLGNVEGVGNIPESDPAIIIFNHISLIDPIAILYVLKRNIVPLAKIEVYDYPFIGIFPKLWGVIPVLRGEVDRNALREVLSVLKAGEIVLIAPEGTRGDGLIQGKEGIAYIASRYQVPIIPAAVTGTTKFPSPPWSKAWKEPGIEIKFGKPFRYLSGKKWERSDYRLMTDEAMFLLSRLLPEELRGEYSDLSQASQDTIEFTN